MEGFSISEINDKIFSRIAGKSFKVNCTVPPSELRYVELLHKDLSGKILRGEMICNVRIADDLLDIFQKLFAASYPIEKVHLIDEYNADDELSMQFVVFQFPIRIVHAENFAARLRLGCRHQSALQSVYQDR